MTPWPTSCCAWPGTPRSTSGSLRRHRVSGTQVTQGTLWDEPPIEVMLAAYDVTLASTSAGKDSSAMLAYLVARARVEGVLDRLVAVHADLGVIEFRVRSACCPRPCCRGPRSAGGCPTSGCCTGLERSPEVERRRSQGRWCGLTWRNGKAGSGSATGSRSWWTPTTGSTRG